MNFVKKQEIHKRHMICFHSVLGTFTVTFACLTYIYDGNWWEGDNTMSEQKNCGHETNIGEHLKTRFSASINCFNLSTFLQSNFLFTVTTQDIRQNDICCWRLWPWKKEMTASFPHLLKGDLLIMAVQFWCLPGGTMKSVSMFLLLIKSQKFIILYSTKYLKSHKNKFNFLFKYLVLNNIKWSLVRIFEVILQLFYWM